MSLSDWMSGISNSRTLGEIIMPGSHDAGMSEQHMNKGTGLKIRVGRTQSKPIAEQLETGCRFFDLRIKSTGIIFKTNRAVHEPGRNFMNIASCFGQAEEQMLQEVKTFLDAHNNEVVLLRISKSGSNVYKALTADCQRIFGNKQLYKSKAWGENLLNTEIGALRGKALILVDDPDQQGIMLQRNGIHAFYNVTKHPEQIDLHGKDNINGVLSCGSYSDAETFKGMLGEFADQATGLDAIKQKAKKQPQIYHWGKHAQGQCGCKGAPHLFMVYWTFTSTMPWNNVLSRTNKQNIEAGVTTTKENPSEKTQASILKDTHKRLTTIQMINKDVDPSLELISAVEDEMGEWGFEGHEYEELRQDVIKSKLDLVSAKNLLMPNVVMYDFINDETSQQIIELNHKSILNEVSSLWGFEGSEYYELEE